MLAELIKYTTTDCNEYARKMGYLAESIATSSRYNRCKEFWRPHLDNTQKHISESLNTLYKKRKVLIIGCGNFLDIPIKELSEKFKEVICVDIIFSKKAMSVIKKYDLTYYQIDITAVAEQIYHKPEVVPESVPLFFLEDNEIDFVISCNILSQLPYIPVKWLSKYSYYSDENMDEFSRHLIQRHVDYLKSFPARAMLITDISVDVYNEEGSLIECYDPLYGVKLPEPKAKWRWQIAPLHEHARNRSSEHDVGLFIL